MNTIKKDDNAVHIKKLREQLGDQVILLGHHYQQQNVIDHCDIVGDSLELARKSSKLDTPHIVFCGVYFMGESAALLAKPNQNVYLPEPEADCVMSLMSPGTLVEKIMQELTKGGRKLIPLAYVNTSLEVKAVVGQYGGAVCTSANAETMLQWALKQGDGVLFLPDKNLARNTAKLIGIPEEDTYLLDIRKKGNSLDLEAASKASLLIWPGQCAIHARFNMKQVDALRLEAPDAKIVVHPECTPDLVAQADAAGSTTRIINFAKSLPKDSTLYIGTEINLVRRLERENADRIKIKPLLSSACSHMAKVTPAKVRRTLEQILKGTATPITIDPAIVAPARASLERMLSACS